MNSLDELVGNIGDCDVVSEVIVSTFTVVSSKVIFVKLDALVVTNVVSDAWVLNKFVFVENVVVSLENCSLEVVSSIRVVSSFKVVSSVVGSLVVVSSNGVVNKVLMFVLLAVIVKVVTFSVVNSPWVLNSVVDIVVS